MSCKWRKLSIVIPAFNEAESLRPLHQEIRAALTGRPEEWEIIFVNDGSADESQSVIAELAATHPEVRFLELRRNFGKAAALDAGFKMATGDIIFTMDADLQDDPAEIPKFLAEIEAGKEVVSGWKKVRHDPADKTLPSRLFNMVVSKTTGLKLHDFNCGFKAYVREAVAELSLYGEMHRFIPVLLHAQGFKVGEVAVNHRPRKFGKSKYGFTRLIKGLLDLMTVLLNTRFLARPLHIFGGIGLLLAALGFICLAYLSILWVLGFGPIGNRPLLFLGLLLMMAGLQVLTVGLLGEFIQRRSATSERSYTIRSSGGLPSAVSRMPSTTSHRERSEA